MSSQLTLDGRRLVAKWGDKDPNWKKELAKFEKGGKDLAEFAPPPPPQGSS
jgi:hypothetical protein